MTVAEIDIIREVKAAIDAKLEAGKTTSPWELVQDMLDHHAAIEGADSDWYLCLAAGHLRDLVRGVVRGRRDAEMTGAPDQLSFHGPGYAGTKRVQFAYTITRQGQEIIVPTKQLSAVEMRAKAIEIRRMGIGCFEHADELDALATQIEAQQPQPHN